ncbi:MAG TPA: metal ABC transporter ATP-binding protein [Herpetosiphon sp.]|uniref:ABC transporter related n=1 Tax=Herpetosiphon aurantiacus (strain ATCC 23779 / DSM 785 / 114-95) TaxID=316274 RepID=A9B4W0_HERA2|nr:metal ABC transporter ATP-binding protein [Herpetosiphon sp.]ABX05683.1 ABC transporter related [Herpetosiphon aurantiacus DSM 785]HBW53085.1 metal ABC transporter ATP-binding protein [Herpetosiphon sp.]
MAAVASQAHIRLQSATSLAPALEVRQLNIRYDQRTVLSDVSFQAQSSQLIGIIGPNGAGKTSLIKAILGLIPSTGQILVAGQALAKRSRKVAYVPQISAVNWRFPASVRDVVLMGRYGQLGWLRRPKKADYALADAALEQVNMQDFAERSIADLSGGQQQRVFLARALAQEPDVLLLDEPISGVDVPTQEVILHLLRDLSSAGRTLLVTTHHLQHLEHHFDALLCLNQCLIAYGPPTAVMTREVVEATFGRSLVLVPSAERIILDCNHGNCTEKQTLINRDGSANN